MQLTFILSVGQDPVLLANRNLILRTAGYIVESAHSVQQAARQLRSGDFDLVLLCHTIEAKDRDRLTCLIRASGSLVPVVCISLNGHNQGAGFADASIGGDPRDLLRAVEKSSRNATQISGLEPPHSRRNAYAKLAIDPRSRKIVLCIDDDPNMLMIRRMLLENAGYRVLTTSNGCDGIKVFSAGVADVAVLDYAMPLMNGSAVAAQMRQIKAEIPLILLSGCTSIPEEDCTLFDHCISKGDAPSRLFSALEKACLDSDRQNR
jgi:DNA-binding response OmpR family regulator